MKEKQPGEEKGDPVDPPVTNCQPASLTTDQLFHRCDPQLFDFKTTDELDPIDSPLGQERAVDAVKLGIGMGTGSKEFNLFVMGSIGLGKREIVKQLLNEHQGQMRSLSDWCYVNNFNDPYQPLVLKMPQGTGKRLQHWVKQLVDEIQKSLPTIMKGDEINRREDEIQSELEERQSAALKIIEDEAEKHHQILKKTKSGYSILPEKDGKVLNSKEFKALPLKERQAIDRVSDELRRRLISLLKQIPLWEKETQDKIDRLEREFADMTLTYLVGQLPSDLSDIPGVTDYVAALKNNLLDNIQWLIERELQDDDQAVELEHQLRFNDDPLRQYQVHLIVDNSKQHKPPIVFENNPTYTNLLGHIEHRGELGTLITHFTLIRPGALHKANGGFLLLDAEPLLTKPYAWDALKRALFSRELRIEPLEHSLGFTTVSTIKPATIPLDVKVVLMGSRMIYYLLKQYDPEFFQLFKLQADCAEEIERTPQSCRLYARLLHSLQQQAHRQALSRNAVARIIEFSGRQAEDASKLSLHHGELNSLLAEASYRARELGGKVLTEEAITQTIAARQQRCGYLKTQLYEQIYRGINQVVVTGEKIGQLNGLSVLSMDENSFGLPVRITATVHLGHGKVVNIDREVELSGTSHSKGMMILTAFLRARYEQFFPLSLSATLTFEQSHSRMDGDSASAAELCVLLSAIAKVPLTQTIAVTGAIDQHGAIEAIGGVNEKIEGFFEICKTLGLTGQQGVIIPQSNCTHLMLNEEVRQAVANQQFYLWPVTHVDQMMALLTGHPMGERDHLHHYPAGSINQAVMARIKLMNKNTLDTQRSGKPSKN